MTLKSEGSLAVLVMEAEAGDRDRGSVGGSGSGGGKRTKIDALSEDGQLSPVLYLLEEKEAPPSTAQRRGWKRRLLPNIAIQIDRYLDGAVAERALIVELINCESGPLDMIDILDTWQIPSSNLDLSLGTHASFHGMTRYSVPDSGKRGGGGAARGGGVLASTETELSRGNVVFFEQPLVSDFGEATTAAQPQQQPVAASAGVGMGRARGAALIRGQVEAVLDNGSRCVVAVTPERETRIFKVEELWRENKDSDGIGGDAADEDLLGAFDVAAEGEGVGVGEGGISESSLRTMQTTSKADKLMIQRLRRQEAQDSRAKRLAEISEAASLDDGPQIDRIEYRPRDPQWQQQEEDLLRRLQQRDAQRPPPETEPPGIDHFMLVPPPPAALALMHDPSVPVLARLLKAGTGVVQATTGTQVRRGYDLVRVSSLPFPPLLSLTISLFLSLSHTLTLSLSLLYPTLFILAFLSRPFTHTHLFLDREFQRGYGGCARHRFFPQPTNAIPGVLVLGRSRSAGAAVLRRAERRGCRIQLRPCVRDVIL